ncbi:MAG: hypothetical protein MUD15_09395 [Desulfobacterota bacterium]|jgi:hypothetical protein|nr:hypothetical protein [Thermodesulfobacteriota bacterium]
MPMKKTMVVFFMICIFALCGSVTAEENLGIKVYPGAKLDAETTKFLKEGLNMKGTAYRTSDPVAKVLVFYKAQPGLKFMGGDAKNAMFRKDGKVDVTIQSPWQNMKTGQMMKDTLISIVQIE